MTNYSDIINNTITVANDKAVVLGADSFTSDYSTVSMVQQAFNNVTQSGTVVVTHTTDSLGKRITQLYELQADQPNVSNTTLDFDLADEGKFVQETAVSGTVFADGAVTLYAPGEPPIETGLDATTVYNPAYGHLINSNNTLELTTDGVTIHALSKVTLDGTTGIKVYMEAVYHQRTYAAFGICSVNGGYNTTANIPVTGVVCHNWSRVYKGTTMVVNDQPIPEDGDTVMIAFNCVTNRMWVGVNGTWYLGGDPAAGTNPSINGADIIMNSDLRAIVQQRVIGNQITVKFKDSEFLYTPPVGFNDRFGDDGYITTPKYVTTSDQNHLALSSLSTINYVDVTSTVPTNTDIKYLFSFDNRLSWQKAAHIKLCTGGTATASSYNGSNPDYNADKAFDDSTTSQWVSNATTAGEWLSYALTTSKTVRHYIVQAGGAGWEAYGPLGWILQGWTGSSWTDLHTVSGLSAWQAYERKSYSFSNSTAYTTYRLYVTTNAAWNHAISELELYESDYENTYTTVSGITFDNDCTLTAMQRGLQNYPVSDELYLDFAFQLSTTDSNTTPSLDQVTVNYDENGNYEFKYDTDYNIVNATSTTTEITKNSVGTSNIKVNVLLP
ncbi:MAG TPA: hypothetical protein VI911_08300 [Patescibacteria group bacterium]|nr:hypothetical protein [Patescibacteria group bacterium]